MMARVLMRGANTRFVRGAPEATGDRRTAQNEYMDLANNENLMAPMLIIY